MLSLHPFEKRERRRLAHNAWMRRQYREKQGLDTERSDQKVDMTTVEPVMSLGLVTDGEQRTIPQDAQYRARLQAQGLCIKCRRLPIAKKSTSRCYTCLERVTEEVLEGRRRRGRSASGLYPMQSAFKANGYPARTLDWALMQHRVRTGGDE